ncbi:MAG: hypothetical protein HFJ79_07225 [Clostridiales bacterium]|nr:hypothetical protein [Clostridiales bacterium]
MRLGNDLYEVTVTEIPDSTFASEHTQGFDDIFLPETVSVDHPLKALAIEATGRDSTWKVCPIGDCLCFIHDYAYLEGDQLIVLQNDTISQIDIRTHQLAVHQKLECFGCCLGMYPCPGGYIVYGEMEIFRIDERFDTVWRVSGADKFVSPDIFPPFKIEDGVIKVYDWDNNYYEFNFDWHCLDERRSE